MGVNWTFAGPDILHAVHSEKLNQMQHLAVAHAHVLEESGNSSSSTEALRRQIQRGMRDPIAELMLTTYSFALLVSRRWLARSSRNIALEETADGSSSSAKP